MMRKSRTKMTWSTLCVEAMEDTLEQIAQKLGTDTNAFDTEEFKDDDDFIYSYDDETGG